MKGNVKKLINSSRFTAEKKIIIERRMMTASECDQ
jgi:hypothetical protein